jgi:hypothetical protein
MSPAVPMAGLRSLLADCTVRISVPGDAGTGFFVAEGLVLTCAHVVKNGRINGDAPTVRWQAAEETAEYVAVLPEPSRQHEGPYPYPDLALLRVPFRGHPCAYLSADVPMAGDPAYSWGYPVGYEQGDPVAGLEYEGVTGGDEPFLKLSDAQVTPGMSGAPLLNLRSGAIDGIIKLTRDAVVPVGARGIPVGTIFARLPQLLAAQAEHCSHDHRWAANMTPWQRWLAMLEARAADMESAVQERLRGFSEGKLAAALTVLPPRHPQEAPADSVEALTSRLFDATLPMLKIVTAEKLGPYPPWNALDIYEIVGPFAWITIPATARLRQLIDESLDAGTRPVAVLNMADGGTGTLYVRYASGTYPLPGTWRVAVWQREPEETTEDGLAASLTAAVQEVLPRFAPGSPEYNHFINSNPVVVVIPPPVPDAGLITRLRREQPKVFFLLLAGSDARDAAAALSGIPSLRAVYLEPEGDPRLEEAWALEFRVTQIALKEPS